MARTLQGFVDTTSLHGPAEIFYSKSSTGRLYWSVIFAAMVTIGIYFIYTVVVSYLEAPITTLVITVDVKSMLLPKVAICYSGAIDAGKLLENGLSKQAVRAVQKQFAYLGRSVERAKWNETVNAFMAAKPEILEFMANRNISGYGNLIKYASFNCSSLIAEYNQYDNYSNYSCKSLETLPHALYGTCYILPTIEQEVPFVMAGWTILLKAPLEHDLVQDLRYTRSFALQVDNTYDGMTAKVYKLPLNRTVTLSLQLTKYKRLRYRRWPRSNAARCHQSTENETYLNCPYYCYYRQMLKQCNCFPFYMGNAFFVKKYENLPACWPDGEYESEMTLAEEKEVENCVQLDCLTSCDESEYGVVGSYADFGAEQMITELGLTGSTQGVIHLQIGYDAMRYTSIEEQDTSGLDGCISDIGGMLGLWLGGSIFTIIHLLTTLCGCCRQKTQILPTPSGADGTVRTTQSIGLNATSRKQDLQSDTCIKIDLEAGFEISVLQQCG